MTDACTCLWTPARPDAVYPPPPPLLVGLDAFLDLAGQVVRCERDGNLWSKVHGSLLLCQGSLIAQFAPEREEELRQRFPAPKVEVQ